MIFAEWILRNWKLVGVALILIVIGLAIHDYGAKRFAAGRNTERLESADAQTEALSRASEVDREWQVKYEKLQVKKDSVMLNLEPLRLCIPEPQMRISGAAGVPNGSAPTGKPVMSAGPNIAAPILVYGADAEECRLRLKGLQDWISSIRGK